MHNDISMSLLPAYKGFKMRCQYRIILHATRTVAQLMTSEPPGGKFTKLNPSMWLIVETFRVKLRGSVINNMNFVCYS